VDQRSSFHTARCGQLAQRGLDRRRIEAVERCQTATKLSDVLGHSRWPKVLRDGRFVVGDRVGEEESPEACEVAETFGAWLQQLEDRKEPRPPRGDEIVLPQAGRLERRPQTRRELARREPHDVLLIEPIQLFWIEDSVAAADARERERRDELVAREQLLVAAPRRPA